jgi:hypothetical protein
MGYNDRVYDLYVILGSAQRPLVWKWDEWKRVASLLDEFVELARANAAVRSTQFEGDGRRAVSFGKIGWNEKGHEKWTHESPKTAGISSTWRFLGMEMWAPAWSVCEKDGQPPDVFFALRNEAFWQNEKTIKFNPTVIFAVAVDFPGPVLDRGRQTAVNLARYLDAVLSGYQRRPWGQSVGKVGFTGSVQDMLTTGLYKGGQIHDRPVDLSTFAESWQLLK